MSLQARELELKLATVILSKGNFKCIEKGNHSNEDNYPERYIRKRGILETTTLRTETLHLDLISRSKSGEANLRK